MLCCERCPVILCPAVLHHGFADNSVALHIRWDSILVAGYGLDALI